MTKPKSKISKEMLSGALSEMQKARDKLGPLVRHTQPLQVTTKDIIKVTDIFV